MRIGICGGTFDPFHRGHLDPVLAARDTLRWDRIVYVPAWQQPFKKDRVTASGYDRFAMAALAIREHDALYVTPLELERGGVSYTVDTLEEFHRTYPDASLDWIIGDDNLDELERWKRPERLFELARFVVLTRGGVLKRTAAVQRRVERGQIVFAENRSVPVSATEIRRCVRVGEPIDAFVDPLVSRYIHHYRLYEEDQT